MSSHFGMAVRLAILIAVLIGISGCTAKVSNLALASVENIDASQKYTMVASDVSAKTSQMWILLFGSGEDRSYFKALADLLAEHDGDLVTDLEITTTSYWFLIGFYTDYQVKGNVWRVLETGDAGFPSNEVFSLEYREGRMVLVSEDGEVLHEVVSPPRG